MDSRDEILNPVRYRGLRQIEIADPKPALDASGFVGLVGFDPSETLLYELRDDPIPDLQQSPIPAIVTSNEEESARAHRERVARGIERLTGDFQKVVLAREIRLDFASEVDPQLVADLMFSADPHCFGYCIPTPKGSFIGATPELVVRRTGRRLNSLPLAGTLPRSTDPATDEANARQLINSSKDLGEHRWVVEHLADKLSPFCDRLSVPKSPILDSTDSVWHLATPIEGRLKRDPATAYELAMAVHPTPAIAGSPTALAVSTIRELEDFRRDYYGGLVGYTSEDGDGEWALAIRCCLVSGSTVTAWSGGGIVRDSDPDAEVAETTAKFRSVRRALGL